MTLFLTIKKIKVSIPENNNNDNIIYLQNEIINDLEFFR